MCWLRKKQGYLAKLLVFILLFIFMECEMLLQVNAAGAFTPRNSPPDKSNKYYYDSNYNANAGSSTYAMPNCTTYVLGRVYEITGSRFNISGNAGDYWGNNKTYACSTDAYQPALGAVVCYSNSGAGHVQVVEEIGQDSSGKYICISESNYSGRTKPVKAFNYMKIYLSDLANSTSSGKLYGKILEDNDGYAASSEESGYWYINFQGYIYANGLPDSFVIEDGTRVYNSGVTNITDTSARINAKVSPAGDGTEFGFWYGTSPDNMQKVVENESMKGCVSIWYDLGTGKWTPALKPGTKYYYQIYAVIGGVTYKSAVDSFTTTGDSVKPTISNVKISDVTNEGYTVSCTVTDNVGVTKVCFPTWTDANGQDDLPSSWPSVSAPGANNTYTFRVKVSDHNNEGGLYHTHIYAYDAAGNYAMQTTNATVVLEVPLTGFTLSTSSLNIGKQEIVELGVASYSPSNTTSTKKATWSSENTGIATVDRNGRVTGVSAGTTNIVCTIDGIRRACAVTVADVTVGEWGNWSTSLTDAVTGNPDKYEVQQKTQYRSRTKSTTTSTSSSLSGWTKYGEYWGDWKSSSTSVTATADREVQKIDTYVKTQYNYSHWHKDNRTSPEAYSGWTYEETGWLDAPLTYYATSSLGVPMYKSSTGLGPCNWESNWYNETTRDVYNTTYKYRDKIYQYYQWSNWSDWSDTAKTASDTVEVETRTVYRYREIIHPLSATIRLQDATSGNITEDDVVTVVGSATGGKGSYKYKFAYTYNGETIIEQDYAANSTWSWEPRDGGSFVLTVWVEDEQGTVATQTLNVDVKQVYHISLDVSQVNDLEIGQSRTFTAYVDGVKAENSSLAWTSSNPEVATCLGGKLVGVSAGTTTISCTRENGTVANCMVTVVENLAIKSQPVSESVAEGDRAVFTVIATGNNLSYQWQFRTSASGTWKNSGITGSKTNSITVQGTTARNGYQYRCVITDGSGNTVTSNRANLTVYPKLTITSQPIGQNVEEDTNAVFVVNATGSDLSYQWQFRTSATGAWKNSGVTGSKTNSITVQGTTARNGYQYRCVITDGYDNTLISDEVSLTVAPKLAITGHPASQSVTESDGATFKVTAVGSALSYQWQFRTSATGTWKNSSMTGATTNSITVQGTLARNGYQYRCIVTDGSGNQLISNGAALTVNAKLAITGHPASQSITEGDSATYKVTATGAGLKYQWQFRTSATGTWKNSGMTGATTSSITVQGTSARNGYQYRCVITDGSGNQLTSNGATLTVTAKLAITGQPASVRVTEGDGATFKVTVAGSNLTYQWQFRTSETGTWKNSGMTGSKTNSITVQGTMARNGYQYRCVITDGSGNKVTSNGATLTVVPKLAITSQPVSQNVAVGANAVFKVTATGSSLKYQWQFRTSSAGTWKNSGMTGATTNSITVQGTTARNGYQYRCIITDGTGSQVTSNGATLTVK